MSRVGKLPIEIPNSTEVSVKDGVVHVKGPKGSLDFSFSAKIEVQVEETQVVVSPKDDEAKALWGTTRSIIANMLKGVSEWFTKSLEIQGVGYKFEMQGKKLILSIGYSHKVDMNIPEDLTVSMDEKLKNTIHITGIDKQRVGQFASKVKAKKKPEPYKGKGIRYLGEHVRRKAGKTGAK